MVTDHFAVEITKYKRTFYLNFSSLELPMKISSSFILSCQLRSSKILMQRQLSFSTSLNLVRLIVLSTWQHFAQLLSLFFFSYCSMVFHWIRVQITWYTKMAQCITSLFTEVGDVVIVSFIPRPSVAWLDSVGTGREII